MSFGADLRKFQTKTLDKMNRAVRKITLDTFSECILMSPVDTGRFRGNWQTAVGQPVSGTLEAVDPDGSVVIAKVAGVVADVKAGDVIYMANNLPYARRLEEGWSQQAPAGMVALTVQRFQPIANAVFAQIGRE